MPPHRVHPQVEMLRRERLASGVRPVHELTVAAARKAEAWELGSAPVQPVADVLERSLPGPAGEIPVRIYLPERVGPLPVLVYFVGGGWVLGSLEAADPVCRSLANATPCAVVSVAYRLAPENPFPAGLEDCYVAARWIAEHGAELGLDPVRLAVGGASAGGNLAAAVALLARERAGPHIALQLLVYPPLDYRAATPSMREPVEPPSFGPDDVAWCWSHYLADDADGESPLASPVRALDLGALPAALVITAELDPLRDEGELYAVRLREAGVPAKLVRFDGIDHGFFSRSDRIDAAADAHAIAATALRKAFEKTVRREDPTEES